MCIANFSSPTTYYTTLLSFKTSLEAIKRSPITSLEPKLPRLPLEIIFMVVDNVPLDHIIPLRAVCPPVRYHIDRHVLFAFLRRTNLICTIDEPTDQMGRALDGPVPAAVAQLEDLQASFSHLERHQGASICTTDRGPPWDGTHAIFRIDTNWLATFNHLRSAYRDLSFAIPGWKSPRQRFEFLVGPDQRSNWYMQVDHAASDLDLNITDSTLFPRHSKNHFLVDLNSGTIRVEWKRMLWTFLERETRVTRRLATVCFPW